MLAALPGDEPAGPNLENEAEFGELERAARGKPEQQHGTLIVPKEEPDWAEVARLATALTARSHDLRILSHLAVARLHLSGLPAFAGVVGAIRGTIETQWPAVHPQLDPEDDLDPTLRANALLALASPVDVLPPLRDATLAASARTGRISWRDIAIATGVLDPPSEQERPSEAVIHAAFEQTDPARLDAVRAGCASILADATAIRSGFDAQAGSGTGPDLTELVKLVRDIQRAVERYAPVGAAAAGDPVAEDAPASNDPAAPAAPAGAARSPAGVAGLGPISTRADALRLLELVGAYYARYEPSSPLPLLLDRARRLADMSFMDILRDLAPDGVSQAIVVAGSRDEE